MLIGALPYWFTTGGIWAKLNLVFHWLSRPFTRAAAPLSVSSCTAVMIFSLVEKMAMKWLTRNRCQSRHLRRFKGLFNVATIVSWSSTRIDTDEFKKNDATEHLKRFGFEPAIPYLLFVVA
jgi:hypothetical protein